ncbi:transporter substrate-binding domain-containing protein [Natronosalvus halobius]|uniref:transporter substrate-binding domain-containing protein n=1 Tax=Natronosalvus halobius TaxID=2953746 RepID=UPI0020A0884B|nr:transporter substrate-binding domain-containing protein [Natronosalvus halobius]USZ72177.1 transporter substrate-binding domain-containing protein [Natronosalvus halobius]
MTRRFDMDRRAYLKTVGAVGATAGVAGCLGDVLGGGDDTIIPGTAPGFAPFEFTNDDGELVGFDIDLAEETIDRAGYEVGDWTEIEFESLIPELTEENIDLAAAGMTITEERQETIAFSEPYYESDQAVLVASDGDLDPGSVEDLEGAVVGAQTGTTGEGEVETLVEDGIVAEDDTRQYQNYPMAVQDLENGNVDAIIIDIPVAQNFESGRDVEVAFEIETGEVFGFGMRQDDDRIGDINDALAEIRDDGTYEDLIETWFE